MKAEKKTNEKYSKSFLAKIIQSDEQTKRYYSVLKNELLSFGEVKGSFDWRWETFCVGKKSLAKLRLRGKTLSICLALNADDYAGSRYDVEKADVKSLADTPCLYLIKDYKRLMYAKQLIGVVMGNHNVARTKEEEVDYIAQYPYETDEALIKKKLIKVTTDEDAQSDAIEDAQDDVVEPVQKETVETAQKKEVEPAPKKTVAESKSDVVAAPKASEQSSSVKKKEKPVKKEVAAPMIEKTDSVSDRTKSGIINLDTLSACFHAGETVTLGEIKKRVKGFDKKVTCIKVLARGKLEKSLTVEADKFSLRAATLIVAAGGKAIKKSTKK